MTRQSLIEFLDEYGRRGKEVAVAHRRGYRMERWSYGRVADTARGFAGELAARGIAPGERVLLWGDNCAEWVAAFFGCVLRGVVVVPIDRVATAEFARRVAQTVEAKLLIGSRDVPEIGLQSGVPIRKIALEDIEEIAARHVVTQSVFANDIAAKNAKRSDAVEIVFTSGTTAEPRGVVLTHGNILANIEPLEAQIQEYLRYEKFVHPLRFLNLLPLSHVFGQMLGVFIPSLLAGTVVFIDSLRPAEFVDTIRRERVSVVVAVPRFIESLQREVERLPERDGQIKQFQKTFALAEHQHFLRRWWSFRKIHSRLGWKFWAFISGGAALPKQTETFWTRLGYAVIQGYGMTETTSLISLNHPFRSTQGSIGKVFPGMEVRVDRDGEILVRGENVATSYRQNGQTLPVAESDGWFRTGDVADADGT